MRRKYALVMQKGTEFSSYFTRWILLYKDQKLSPIITWQSMVYKLLLNLIGSLLLYNEFILHWFSFYGTFEQLIWYWSTFHGKFDEFISKLYSQMIELSHTVAHQLWFGACSQVQAWNDVKSYSDVQFISAVFYFICLRFRLVGQFWEICNLSLYVHAWWVPTGQSWIRPIRLHELVDLQNKYDKLFNLNWTLQVQKKQLHHNCMKQVVRA